MPDEFSDLESEAQQWLGENPDHQSASLITRLRDAAKRAEKRGREAARTEFEQGRARESAFARLKVPEVIRPLFEGIDVTDEKAVQSKVDAIKAAGFNWETPPPEAQQQTQQQQTQQQPIVPVQVDPNLQAQLAMQQAAAGGGTPGQQGDLATRMQAMEANPGKYTQDQIDQVVQEYNEAVTAAARQGTSGALG